MPAAVLALLVYGALTKRAGFLRLRADQVAVVYDDLFGGTPRVVTQPGLVFFVPGLHSVRRLDVRPELLMMEGDTPAGPHHTPRLTLRGADGAPLELEYVEVAYRVRPSEGAMVLSRLGPEPASRARVAQAFAAAALQEAFGTIALDDLMEPRVRERAAKAARERLTERLSPFGIEVTDLPPPKLRLSQDVQRAVAAGAAAVEQATQEETKRRALEAERDRRVAEARQARAAEQAAVEAELTAKLETAKTQAVVRVRKAEIYAVTREADGRALQAVAQARAASDSAAALREAEALAERIHAVGSSPALLDQAIAAHVLPQLGRARPTPEPPAESTP